MYNFRKMLDMCNLTANICCVNMLNWKPTMIWTNQLLTNHCESNSRACLFLREDFLGSCLSDLPTQMFLNLTQKPANTHKQTNSSGYGKIMTYVNHIHRGWRGALTELSIRAIAHNNCYDWISLKQPQC